MTDRQTTKSAPNVSFTRSTATFTASLFRLLLVLECVPSEWIPWIQSPVAQSMVIDGAFSLPTFEGALAVAQIYGRDGYDHQRFADAYQGQTHPIPPLLLALMQPLITTFSLEYAKRVGMGLILLMVDFAIAWTLETIGRILLTRKRPWEEGLERRMVPKLHPPLSHLFPLTGFLSSSKAPEQAYLWPLETLPTTAALLFYGSPVTMLSGCALQCFQTPPLLALLVAMLHACRDSGSVVWSAFFLSIATYLQIHNILFLIPLALLFGEQKRKRKGVIPMFCGLFLVFSIVYQIFNVLLVGKKAYAAVVLSTHGATFRLTGMAPSLSTLWYLGMELFGRFDGYFTIFLAGLPYVLVFPTAIRLYRYPEELVALYWLLGTLFRPPATLFSLNVGFCLLIFSPRSLARVRFVPALIAFCGLVVPVSLYAVDYWLWLETGTGEANFVYFQCLAYNVFVTILFLQFLSATLRRDKALRITEKSKSGKVD